MNLFALTIWTTAVLPLFGHLYCLWTIRRMVGNPHKTNARVGVLLGLVIVAANFAQLIARTLPNGQHGSWGGLLITSPILACLLFIPAIAQMRRSTDFDVQSVGIPSTVLSLFSMATVVALGGMTLAG